MLKRIAVSSVVAVAVVLAVQVLMRNGSPPSLVTPPRMELPALDRRSEPERSPAVDPAAAAVPAAELVAETAPRKFQRRLMFDCGDVLIFVRVGEGEAALLPQSSLTGQWIPLHDEGSEWRGRYANENLVFRPDGDSATFVLGNQTLENCSSSPSP